ncbi:MAG: cyclase family protein [Saprospiraceae bacterium]|nr:cyclase family protein [Saprospiraceae bacterium]
MKATIQHNQQTYQINLNQPIDISMPLGTDPENTSAWYCPPVEIKAVETEHFIGDVNRGGVVNFRNIFFNPHGNGTHTECVGHISKEWNSINQHLKNYFFLAQLLTVQPEISGEDQIITKAQLQSLWQSNQATDAIIIRTLPNEIAKLKRHYTNTNPPYLSTEAAHWLVEQNIKHLLIDLPSVDREQDEGKLAVHHIFWNYPVNPRLDCTITELVYIPDSVKDGHYFLNLQVAPFENDASPSRPVLYTIED